MSASDRENPRISIVVPVLGEEAIIDRFLENLWSLQGIETCEVILVDGDPEKSTLSALQPRWREKVIGLEASQGRAIQMNVGAEWSRAAKLLFLHADTRLPENALERVEDALENDEAIGGAFGLAVDSQSALIGFLAWLATWRTHITRIPYGDQAIFIRKDVFRKLGGYLPLPILEDVDLMRRIRKHGFRIEILSEKAVTASRRWDWEGVVAYTLRNRLMMLFYNLGVAPDRLNRWYRLGMKAGGSK